MGRGKEIDPEDGIPNPYTFTGREFGLDTGLYYYRARYYDPHLGRFLQEDPIGFIGEMNLYTYVLNNPVNYIDPYGQIVVVVPVLPVLPKVIIGIGGAIATYIWWLQSGEAIEEAMIRCAERVGEARREAERRKECDKKYTEDYNLCQIVLPHQKEECYGFAILNWKVCMGQEPPHKYTDIRKNISPQNIHNLI
jgi:RHS repeat-associated protein